jgi:maleate isomerase
MFRRGKAPKWALRFKKWNALTGGSGRQPAKLPAFNENVLPAPMPDALAPRLKFGVIAPATNTIVQPEFDAMRPRGVTNQMARVVIPDSPVGTESEFAAMMGQVRGNIEAALDAVMACSPSAAICGLNAETFWEGVMDANAVQAHLEARAGVKVILGVQACLAAIQRYGGIRRISVITPYMPSGDAQVRRSFTDSGFEVVNLLGLKSNSPLLMAHESPERLRRAVREVDDSSVELILQVGTNLAFAAIAAEAERWLGKPVLAVNTCTYWHALRSTGIEDKIEGFGSLLTEH